MKTDRGPLPGRILKLLGSRKLSFFLLALLSVLAAERAIISQRAVTGENVPGFLRLLNFIGLNSGISLTVPLLVVLVLFVINLSLSSIRMTRVLHARHEIMRGLKSADQINLLENTDAFQMPIDRTDQDIIAFFKHKKFRMTNSNSEGETRIRATKRAAGVWGVLFFHLAFFAVLIGVVLSLLTRSVGYVELSPGDIFIEKRDGFLYASEKPLLFGQDRMFRLQLDQIGLAYWKPGVVKQRASVVTIYDRAGSLRETARLEINKPVTIEETNVYQGTRQGFVADLEAVDSVGTKSSGLVRFRLPDTSSGAMSAVVRLPGTNLHLELELLTDKLGDIKGLEEFRSKFMATLIKVVSREEDRRMFRGVIFLGSRLVIDDLTLRFVSLKPYSSLVFIRDYGVPVIFSGCFFLLLGLIITYFWVPETYWAVILNGKTENSVIIGANVDRYRESFKERFAEEMAQLRSEVLAS